MSGVHARPIYSRTTTPQFSASSIPWLIFILTLSLGFPLQVEFDNPYITIVPYLCIAPFLFLRLTSPSTKQSRLEAQYDGPPDLIVRLYLYLCLIKIGIGVSLGVVDREGLLRSLFIYVLPVLIFYYVRYRASEQDIKAILAGIVVSSVIIGAYFVYDTALKLIFHEVSEYQQKALQYATDRQNINLADANAFRTDITMRSFGLLARHSFSAAWVSLGVFAAFALIPETSRRWRSIVLVTGLGTLLIGNTLSSIVSFTITYYLLHARSIRSLSRRRLASSISTQTAAFCLLTAVLAGAVACYVNSSIKEFIDYSIDLTFSRINVIFDLGGGLDYTLIGSLVAESLRYAGFVVVHPYVLLFGEIPGHVAAYAKSGDIGFVEDAVVLGIPLFVLVTLGLVKSLIRFNKQRTSRIATDCRDSSYVFRKCALSVLLSLALMEIHYSVVFERSLFPVALIAVGLIARYPLSTRSAGTMLRA